MYRRLEPKPEKVESKDASSEAECKCNCGKDNETEGDKKPAANFSITQIGNHYDING